LEVFAIEDVGIFYVHLVHFFGHLPYFMEGFAMKMLVHLMSIWYIFSAICHILWTFGIFPGLIGIFFLFWYVEARKIWQPWLRWDRRRPLHQDKIFSTKKSKRGEPHHTTPPPMAFYIDHEALSFQKNY
jgi:hypothetical protein